jgi:hypothetical protein
VAVCVEWVTALVPFESLVDSTVTEFFKQLSERYANRDDKSVMCDFRTWLQFYALDVIEELTCSRQLGFLSCGVDVDGIIHHLEMFIEPFCNGMGPHIPNRIIKLAFLIILYLLKGMANQKQSQTIETEGVN